MDTKILKIVIGGLDFDGGLCAGCVQMVRYVWLEDTRCAYTITKNRKIEKIKKIKKNQKIKFVEK